MGDIFDFILCESRYFVQKNHVVIDTINALSQQMEIIYLEGNHDFNMESLFTHVKVIKRAQQPLGALWEDKRVELSHGDIFTPWHYNLFCAIVRNSFLLKLLNFLDIGFWLSKKIDATLQEKSICLTMKDFNAFAEKRVNNYNSDIIIEGHFHQGKNLMIRNQLYINIPSLCCEKKYTVLDGSFQGVLL